MHNLVTITEGSKKANKMHQPYKTCLTTTVQLKVPTAKPRGLTCVGVATLNEPIALGTLEETENGLVDKLVLSGRLN
jgi:hypothetical protein